MAKRTIALHTCFLAQILVVNFGITERALTLVESASLNPKAKDKFKAGVEVQLQKLKKRKDAKENTTEASDQEQERKEKRNASVTQVGQAHPQYPGLDHRLEVAHTDGQGRFVLAHLLPPLYNVNQVCACTPVHPSWHCADGRRAPWMGS